VLLEVQDVLLEVQDVLLEVQDVLLEVQDVLLEVRDVLLEVRDVLLEVRDVLLIGTANHRYLPLRRPFGTSFLCSGTLFFSRRSTTSASGTRSAGAARLAMGQRKCRREFCHGETERSLTISCADELGKSILHCGKS
jgi:hypothetical protein